MSATAINARRRAVLAKRNARRELDQARFSVTIRALFHRRTYVQTEDGFRVRVFGDDAYDRTSDEDVRQWLLGKRYVEDLREGLEYVRPAYVKEMVRKGWLREDPVAGGTYAVTAACSERFRLPPVMGCKFPPAEGGAA